MKFITIFALLAAISSTAWARHSLRHHPARATTIRRSYPTKGHKQLAGVVKTRRTAHYGLKHERQIRSHLAGRPSLVSHYENHRVRPMILTVRSSRPRHRASSYSIAYNTGLMFGIPQSVNTPWPVWTEATVRRYSSTFGKQIASMPKYSSASYTTSPNRVAVERADPDPVRTSSVTRAKKEFQPAEIEQPDAEFDDAAVVPTGHRATAQRTEQAQAQPSQTEPADSESGQPAEAQYIGKAQEMKSRLPLSLRPSGPPIQVPVDVPDRTDDVADLVIIVFKDGRPPERIRNYMLSRSTLSIVGKRMRDIPVEDLDMVASENVNREAGIEFRLPDELR